MKKGLITLLILVFLCVASLASATPVASDVPKDHWAYPAIQELIKAGLVDGYPDGTFRGDKTMTRYEMAQIIQKAAANMSKATFEQKSLIEKLGVEFALELNKIDARVTALEKNQSSLKITGMLNYEYQWVKHPWFAPFTTPFTDPARNGIADNVNTTATSIWLFVDNKFDNDTYFHGTIKNESIGGRSTDATLNLYEGFVAKKMGGNTELAVGRFFPSIGMGFFGAPWMDGVRLSFGDDVKVRLFETRLLTNPIDYGSANYTMADVNFALGKDVNMSLAYVGDSSPSYVYTNGTNIGNTFPATIYNVKMYNDVAVGLEYKGIRNFNIKSEYAVNRSDWSQRTNNGNSKAYFVKVRYKGVNPYVPGSFGLWAEYKHADKGFDAVNNSAPFDWSAPLNWTQPCQGGYADNIKGFEYGFEYTVAPRLLIDARYDNLSTVKGSMQSIDGNYYTAQRFATFKVTYLF